MPPTPNPLPPNPNPLPPTPNPLLPTPNPLPPTPNPLPPTPNPLPPTPNAAEAVGFLVRRKQQVVKELIGMCGDIMPKMDARGMINFCQR